MVVLNGDAALHGERRHGVLGGEVLRVQVVDNVLRLQRQKPREVGQTVREGAVGGQILQIPVVRRNVGAGPAGKREGVLELGAHGQQRGRRGDGQRHGLRRVAARPSDHRLATGDHARH